MTLTRAHPILVTGATGRVGRPVVAELLRAGVPVRALARRPATAGLPATVEVVAGDLTVPSTVTDIVGSPPHTFRQWVADYVDAFRAGPASDPAHHET